MEPEGFPVALRSRDFCPYFSSTAFSNEPWELGESLGVRSCLEKSLALLSASSCVLGGCSSRNRNYYTPRDSLLVNRDSQSDGSLVLVFPEDPVEPLVDVLEQAEQQKEDVLWRSWDWAP